MLTKIKWKFYFADVTYWKLRGSFLWNMNNWRRKRKNEYHKVLKKDILRIFILSFKKQNETEFEFNENTPNMT